MLASCAGTVVNMRYGQRDLEESPQRPNLQDSLLAMYFERLLVGNVRYLGNSAHDFTTGPGRLRRWKLLPSGRSSTALLRSLALAGLGQRQLERLAQRSPPYLAERADHPRHHSPAIERKCCRNDSRKIQKAVPGRRIPHFRPGCKDFC